MMDRIDDLLGDDEEAVAETPEEPKQNNQLQAAQRKLQKAEKELEELRAFKAEQDRVQKDSARKAAAEAAGIPWAQVEFAKALDALEEPNAEAVQALKTQFFGQPEDAEPAPAEEAAGFTPTVISESQALGAKIYPFDEWMKLSQTDREKADQLWKAGRVEKFE